MNLQKVYYTQASIVSLALPFVIEVEGKRPFMVEVPHSELDLTQFQKDQRDRIIQELLFAEVKNVLQTGEFFLIPSTKEVELQAYLDAQMYHPENFPMDSDESIGGIGSIRDDS